MAKQRPIQLGESRIIKSNPATSTLNAEQRAFATVGVEWFGCMAKFVLTFGDMQQVLHGDLAVDFAARIARAMTTAVKPGSRRGFRCGRGLSKQDREKVQVFMHDDFERTWLRLEFDDGETVDFSSAVGADFADRIRRAALIMPTLGAKAA
jgi:hypothetical protein